MGRIGRSGGGVVEEGMGGKEWGWVGKCGEGGRDSRRMEGWEALGFGRIEGKEHGKNGKRWGYKRIDGGEANKLQGGGRGSGRGVASKSMDGYKT